MDYTKHYAASTYNLILRQLDQQDQPQSDTRSKKSAAWAVHTSALLGGPLGCNDYQQSHNRANILTLRYFNNSSINQQRPVRLQALLGQGVHILRIKLKTSLFVDFSIPRIEQ